MDQASLNEFNKVTGIDKTLESSFGFGFSEHTFEAFENEESITVQKRRNYLMEMNEDFDLQQAFKDVNWNQRLTE